MYYHVTTPEGVIYETDNKEAAESVSRSIVDTRVRQGSLIGLREKSREMFGKRWLRGPSLVQELAWAA